MCPDLHVAALEFAPIREGYSREIIAADKMLVVEDPPAAAHLAIALLGEAMCQRRVVVEVQPEEFDAETVVIIRLPRLHRCLASLEEESRMFVL